MKLNLSTRNSTVIIFNWSSHGLLLLEREEIDFVDEEFLHKEKNNKVVYMGIMVNYRRCSRRGDACSCVGSQELWRFDSTKLK